MKKDLLEETCLLNVILELGKLTLMMYFWETKNIDKLKQTRD